MGKIVDIQGHIYLDSNGEEDDILFINPASTHAQPLAELVNDILYKNDSRLVSVRYWTSDKYVSKDKVKEDFIKKTMGIVDAEYSMNYSEVTGYLWTTEELVIGGHDLLKELKSKANSFLFLELEIHDAKTHEIGLNEGFELAKKHIDEYIRDYKHKEQVTTVELSKHIFNGVIGVLTNLRADINSESQKRRR